MLRTPRLRGRFDPTRLLQRVVDLSALVLAFWAAYMLRFDGAMPRQLLVQFLLLCPCLVALEYVLLLWFQMTRSSWRRHRCCGVSISKRTGGL